MSFQFLPPEFRNTFENAKVTFACAHDRKAEQDENQRPLAFRIKDTTKKLRSLVPDLSEDCQFFTTTLENNLEALAEEQVSTERIAPSYAEGLRAPGRRELRALHFTGELVLLLDYFRERYLPAHEDSELRSTLTKQGQAVEGAIERMLGHAVSELWFEAKERTALRQAAQALRRFRESAEDAGGLTKADETVRRRQFIRVVGLLCLRIYGHCTTDLMSCLLEMKSAYHLMPTATEDDENDLPASDKSINRELDTLKRKAQTRARAERWETAELIDAFFARYQWKAWRPPVPSQCEAGSSLSEVALDDKMLR